MTEFDRLHPSVQHHVVNSLAWPGLRPLQEAAIGPVLAGEHTLLLAPTAGGKTEAATFPVLSRMATEGWRPLSVLYLAPLRALLNNLLPRLERYAAYTGHRVGLWHGDVGDRARSRIATDPPDLLLTTPESLEAMLISRRVNERWLFPNLRTVVIDEVHSFAAADRGWHLLAVLERLGRLAGRELQRIGLSATVGNPDQLLAWLTSTCERPSRVVNPYAEAVAEPDVTLDHVGSLDNAATVISRLHRGEKRLVFVDSRRRVEELSVALRARDVATFVSHGSLGRDERNLAEQAFAEASDCVIVATSTLELGIDVGDLDRVIQVDAPSTVAAFLQRVGRTGRRAGSSRNALLLTTDQDALLRAAGLLHLFTQGYIEPVAAPPLPVHLVAQQLLALTLQEGDRGLASSSWTEWLGDPPVLGAQAMAYAPGLLDHFLATGILAQDQGMLGMGPEGERTLGRRHFLELTSAFVADPVLTVLQGRTEIGQVPDVALAAGANRAGPTTLLLAGRAWAVKAVDWKRRRVQVEPGEGRGTIRFRGGPVPLSYELCQAMAAVAAGTDPDVTLTRRAVAALADLRAEIPAIAPGRTLAQHREDRTTWWTFAGLRANLELAARLGPLRDQVTRRDNLAISLSADVSATDIAAQCHHPASADTLLALVGDAAAPLKLQAILPPGLADEVQLARLRDEPSLLNVLAPDAS
ncbi:MAG: DEAD/DEAH box helicase [Acidimicrobiia bacterium]|nr:DEAD/DEAH box helicase [Acidimicrobiia bacterium]